MIIEFVVYLNLNKTAANELYLQVFIMFNKKSVDVVISLRAVSCMELSLMIYNKNLFRSRKSICSRWPLKV